MFYSKKHFLQPLIFPFVRFKGPNHGYVGRFLGFTVYISNTTEKVDGKICFQDNQIFTKYTIPAVLTLNCTHHGRYVIYYNSRRSMSNGYPPDYSLYAYNELCEFEVYGELCLILGLEYINLCTVQYARRKGYKTNSVVLKHYCFKKLLNGTFYLQIYLGYNPF